MARRERAAELMRGIPYSRPVANRDKWNKQGGVMNVLVFLIPAALALGLIALYGLFWSLKRNQYEDLEGAAYRILQDDDLEDKK